MANLTREQILARKIGKGKATLPDGSTVAIRALTRDEVLRLQEIEDIGKRDNLAASMAITNPQLSAEDVALWAAEGNAGDLVTIIEAVQELSGLRQGAGKSSPAAD